MARATSEGRISPRPTATNTSSMLARASRGSAPALLFDNVRGFDIPVATNLFGSASRMASLSAPSGFWAQLIAFVLFRFFDVAKPGPIAWADRQFKGFGARGGFGIPTFFVNEEMFFGKEQLREVEEFVSGK